MDGELDGLCHGFAAKLNSEDISMASYVAVIRKEPNTAYWVDAPDIPGCASSGDTIAAANLSLSSCATERPFLTAGEDVAGPNVLRIGIFFSSAGRSGM